MRCGWPALTAVNQSVSQAISLANSAQGIPGRLVAVRRRQSTHAWLYDTQRSIAPARISSVPRQALTAPDEIGQRVSIEGREETLAGLGDYVRQATDIRDDAAIPFDIEALDGLKQDSLAERDEFELPVPMCEQSDDGQVKLCDIETNCKALSRCSAFLVRFRVAGNDRGKMACPFI
jgi:hypothetical protein